MDSSEASRSFLLPSGFVLEPLQNGVRVLADPLDVDPGLLHGLLHVVGRTQVVVRREALQLHTNTPHGLDGVPRMHCLRESQ